MRKRSSRLSLTAEERELSPELRLLEQRQSIFQKDSDDPHLFAEFCSAYAILASAQGCKKIALALSPEYIQEILKHVTKFGQNREAIEAALEAFSYANHLIPLTTIGGQIHNFFYAFCQCVAEDEEIWEIGNLLFAQIYSDKNTASEFASSPSAQKVLQLAFAESVSDRLSRKLLVFMFDQLNKKFYAKLDTTKFLCSLFSVIYPDTMSHERCKNLTKFLCLLCEELSNSGKNGPKLFRDLKVLNNMRILMKKLTAQEVLAMITRMLKIRNGYKSPAPNEIICQFWCDAFCEREDIREPSFKYLIEISTDEPTMRRIHDLVPFHGWFSYAFSIKAEISLTLLAKLCNFMPQQVVKCLNGIFVSLTREDTEQQTYVGCFAIIEMMLSMRLISLNDLTEVKFLDAFVVMQKPEKLVSCFNEVKTFSQLVVDILSLEKELSKRVAVFKSVIRTAGEFKDMKEFISICAGILAAAPSKESITELMDEVEKTEKYNLLEILVHSLQRSIGLVDVFVEMKGYEWANSLCLEGKISAKEFSFLLVSLVSQKACRPIDEMINEMKPEHPLFTLTKEELRCIVFGGRSGSDVPIRVHSLFHRIDFEQEKIDPYNAYIIGKYVLPKYDDISNLPFLPCVANRYIGPKDLTKAHELPLKMESFCDLSYDHFALFQMYPGTDEMKVTHRYQSISFWFRFSGELDEDLEVLLFRNDHLMLALGQGSLTAMCDTQTFVVDVTPEKWTHVFIRLDKPSITSSYRILVTMNNVFTFGLLPKKEKEAPEFTFASFASGRDAPLLFLGSAIRFSKMSPHDFSIVFGNGPGYTAPSRDMDETLLVTPFSLANVEMPLNCFIVPYMGFSLNSLSNRSFRQMLKCMCNTEDRDTYNSVFKAACNINRLTDNFNQRFWKQLLHAIKHAKLQPTVELFKEALDTVLTKKTDAKLVFSRIIYSGVLWDIIDDEILVISLMDCFPMINWREFPDSDVFLATIVEKNPTNKNIISSIIYNCRKVPKTVKLIAAMMKRGDITEWDNSIRNRTVSTLQVTIIDCLNDIIDQKTVDVVKTMFDFTELRYLFMTSPDSYALKVFDLITSIATLSHEFIQTDQAFELRVSSLAMHKSMWKNIMFLVSGHPNCESDFLKRASLVSAMLSLIWPVAMMIMNVKAQFDKTMSNHLTELEGLMTTSLKYLNKYTPNIGATPDCLNCILTYFPLILNYTVLFDESKPLKADREFTDIPVLKATNLNDLHDPTWSQCSYIAQSMEFGKCPVPRSWKHLLKEVICGFMEDVDCEAQPDWETMCSYISRSKLFEFVGDVLVNVPVHLATTLNNFIFSRPFEEKVRSSFFAARIVGVLLKRIKVPAPPTFSFTDFLTVVEVLAGKAYLSSDPVTIMIELFGLCDRMIAHYGKEASKKHSGRVCGILVQLMTTSINDYSNGLREVFEHYLNTLLEFLVTPNALFGWCYGFRQFFGDKLDVLRSKLAHHEASKILDESCDEETIARAKTIWNDIVSEVHTRYTAVKMTLKHSEFPIITNLLDACTKYVNRKYVGACKHLLISKLIDHTFMFYDSTFLIHVEKGIWSNFCTNQQEARSDVSSFAPQTYHLSVRCTPFYPPMVLQPSMMPYVSDDYENSPVVKTFNDLVMFKDKPLRRSRESLFNLFCKSVPELGTLLAAHNCSLLRYMHAIPCVSFWFGGEIVLLTFAQMNEATNELQLIECSDAKQFHIFIESVFLGNYGITTLFASHIAVKIPLDSVLYIHKHTPTSLALWTFNSGHLLLQYTEKQIRQITPFFEKINRVAVDSFPIDNFLTQSTSNYDAFTAWSQHRLTTQQLLYSLNSLSGKSYADLANYPFIPNFMTQQVEPASLDAATAAGTMYRILPFRYYTETDLIPGISEAPILPSTVLVLPEMLQNVNNFSADKTEHMNISSSHYSWLIKKSLEFPETPEALKTWIRTHFIINPPRSISVGSFQQKVTGSQRPTRGHSYLMYDSQQLKSIAINVSRRQSRLSIVNIITDKDCYCEYSPFYGHVVNISVSADSVFFALDFAFGLTRIYKVIFSKLAPVTVKLVSEFSAGASPISSVSGHDWVCATVSGNDLVIWEIINGTVHRVITLDDKIVAVSCDESTYSVWAATKTRIYFIGLNGTILGDFKVSHNVCALMTMSEQASAIYGTETGRLYVLRYDFEKEMIIQMEMGSRHTCAIEKIILQRSASRYLSVDASGMVCQWNLDGIAEPESDTKKLEHCSACTNATRSVCKFCNKPVCSKCMSSHMKGPNCRHCLAFI